MISKLDLKEAYKDYFKILKIHRCFMSMVLDGKEKTEIDKCYIELAEMLAKYNIEMSPQIKFTELKK